MKSNGKRPVKKNEIEKNEENKEIAIMILKSEIGD